LIASRIGKLRVERLRRSAFSVPQLQIPRVNEAGARRTTTRIA
jgi:hypothetical protein